MRVVVIGLSVLIVACAQHRPRCDERLRPINAVIAAPAAKPAAAGVSR